MAIEVPEQVSVAVSRAHDSYSHRRGRWSAMAAYLLALLIGLQTAHYLLPRKAVLALDIRDRPAFQYDAAMNVYGQRYFDKEPLSFASITR